MPWLAQNDHFEKNLMLFGHFELHFCSYEGRGNGKLHNGSPKGNYKEKLPWLAQIDNFQ